MSLGSFGKPDGVSIKSSKLKHTGDICCHYVKGGNGARKGKINGHGGGKKSGGKKSGY
jgi:hypothetical protein